MIVRLSKLFIITANVSHHKVSVAPRAPIAFHNAKTFSCKKAADSALSVVYPGRVGSWLSFLV